ncbi:MAG: DUF188 domain-containing protein [Spirochaetaceae bacterium]|jgi:uncharacterized protein YaiI (UPF0178 family)|nr:DUF188 domain-containing protein [Spirochaetaceae bacterium]
MMKILVDADSCPAAARELVLRAAVRTGTQAIFAANRIIPGITGEYAQMLLCPAEEGAADDRLAGMAQHGDLAVTRDIPLASRLLERGAAVLDDRGCIYTAENIREKLSLRNFTVSLAENGFAFERSAAYGKRELKAFAGSFDKLLGKLKRQTADPSSG